MALFLVSMPSWTELLRETKDSVICVETLYIVEKCVVWEDLLHILEGVVEGTKGIPPIGGQKIEEVSSSTAVSNNRTAFIRRAEFESRVGGESICIEISSIGAVCKVMSSTAVSNIRLSFIVRAESGNRVGQESKLVEISLVAHNQSLQSVHRSAVHTFSDEIRRKSCFSQLTWVPSLCKIYSINHVSSTCAYDIYIEKAEYQQRNI